MFETPTPVPATTPLQDIARRTAAPLLLFSAALCMMLLLSYLFLLPRFTQFTRSDGVAMNPRQLVQYQRSLSADITQREEERVRLVMPVADVLYNTLKDRKHATMSLADLREQLLQAAARLGEADDAVHLDMLSLQDGKVVFAGDVRNVHTRSMTVLAAYAEKVVALPFVSALERPVFSREGTPETGFHSPFTMSFTFAE